MVIEAFTCKYCTVSIELALEDQAIINEITPSVRIFECPSCGKVHSKNVNILEIHFAGEKICHHLSFQNRERFFRDEFNPDLNARDVYEIIVKKGVKYLHHANTVRTSISFLENGALLSRGYVEKEKLVQTDQDSDAKDKKYGVWDFLFLDGLDLAGYYGQPNVYGPVLFKFDTELLLSHQVPTVRISKQNPHYWEDGDCLNRRYYTDIKQFEKDYLSAGNNLQDGKTSFIFTTLGGRLNFDPWLKEIWIDDPQVLIQFKGNETNLIDILRETMVPLIISHKIRAKPITRFSHKYQSMYVNDYTLFKKKFGTHIT